MLHPEYVESLKRMTPEQRFAIGEDLIQFAWECLMLVPPDERQRRIDLSREPWNPPPAPMDT